MNSEQKNPLGQLMLLGGLGSAIINLATQLPNPFLWGVIIPLPLVFLGWFWGRHTAKYPASLRFGLIIGLGLVVANLWLVSTQTFSAPQPTNSSAPDSPPQAEAPPKTFNEYYSFEFTAGDEELDGWRVKSKFDTSDRIVSAQVVTIQNLISWGPGSDKRRKDWPDHYVDRLDITIQHARTDPLQLVCDQFAKDFLEADHWENVCKDENGAPIGVTWPLSPYAIGIIIHIPSQNSSHCLFNPQEHPQSICNLVFPQNEIVLTEANRQQDRPHGWQVSIQRQFTPPFLKEEVEIIALDTLYRNYNKAYDIEDIRVRVNYSDYALDFKCHTNRKSIFYGPFVECQTTDSRGGIEIEDTSVRVIDDYTIGFTTQVEERLTSWCFFKASERDQTECVAIHTDNFSHATSTDE